jgi:hypothetical protein
MSDDSDAALVRSVLDIRGSAEEGWTVKITSPLASLLPIQRQAALDAVLEARAMAGDTRAAAILYEHRHWRTEMRKGRAPQRLNVAHHGRITVVDDLGGGQPKQVAAGAIARRSLQSPQSLNPTDAAILGESPRVIDGK